MNNGNEGLENLKELEKLELIINKFKQLITEQESEIETLKKEIALVREDGQAEIMKRDLRITQLEKLEKEHQDLNGKLRVEINRYKEGHDI